MKTIIEFAGTGPSGMLGDVSRQPLFESAPAEFMIGTGAWTAWLGPTATVAMAAGLVLLCMVAWAANLIALPGNWLSVALLAIYAWIGPADGRAAIGVGIVIAAFMAALVGEGIEFIAAAFGAKRAGASRKSTVYALFGSMLGALMGAVFGIPIPVIGSVIAAILFAGLGAAAGAMYGEWNDGRPWRENWSVGNAAFWGRTFGTLGKFIAGAAIVVLALAGVVL